MIKNEAFRFYILLNQNFADVGEIDMEFSYEDNYSKEKKVSHMRLVSRDAVEGDKIHKMAVKKLIDTIE